MKASVARPKLLGALLAISGLLDLQMTLSPRVEPSASATSALNAVYPQACTLTWDTKPGDDFSFADVSRFHRGSDDSTMLATVSPGPSRPPHEGQALGHAPDSIQGPIISRDGCSLSPNS